MTQVRFVFLYEDKLKSAVEAGDKVAVIAGLRALAEVLTEAPELISPDLIIKACDCLQSQGKPGNKKKRRW